MERKEKRNKLQIYYDILNIIRQESKNGVMTRTQVQKISGLSYDKFLPYFEEMQEKKMIRCNSPIAITKKGENFLQDYSKIDQFLKKMKLQYVEGSN